MERGSVDVQYQFRVDVGEHIHRRISDRRRISKTSPFAPSPGTCRLSSKQTPDTCTVLMSRGETYDDIIRLGQQCRLFHWQIAPLPETFKVSIHVCASSWR